MTVRELIAALSEMDGDRIVILQKDSEGNDYSPCEGVDLAIYKAVTTWAGEVYENDETRALGRSEVLCVVLWPVN